MTVNYLNQLRMYNIPTKIGETLIKIIQIDLKAEYYKVNIDNYRSKIWVTVDDAIQFYMDYRRIPNKNEVIPITNDIEIFLENLEVPFLWGDVYNYTLRMHGSCLYSRRNDHSLFKLFLGCFMN